MSDGSVVEAVSINGIEGLPRGWYIPAQTFFEVLARHKADLEDQLRPYTELKQGALNAHRRASDAERSKESAERAAEYRASAGWREAADLIESLAKMTPEEREQVTRVIAALNPEEDSR